MAYSKKQIEYSDSLESSIVIAKAMGSKWFVRHGVRYVFKDGKYIIE